eukprot:5490373-Pleurochrysis_carterae.AAC.1
MVHSLEQQRLDALIRTAESLFAQQRQFSFWTLEQPSQHRITPSTTSAEIIAYRAVFATKENENAKTKWNGHRTNWFSYTFDASNHSAKFAQLRTKGSTSFIISPPKADIPTSPLHSFRYIYARVYFLPTVQDRFRKITLAKLP